MTTWRELFEVDPALAEAARDFRKEAAISLAHAGLTPFPPDTAVVSGPLIALLLWQKLARVERHYQEALQAERTWRMVGTTSVDSGLITYFKSRGGELVALPTPFVEAFATERRLACQLQEDKADRSKIQLVRAGQVEASVPKSLIEFLLDQRRDGAGILRPSHVPSHNEAGRDRERETPPKTPEGPRS